MEFPCGFWDIDKCEKNNNIAINVFGYNEENKKHEFFPLRVGKVEKPDSHLNILLISNEQNNKHYCLIKNMSRLFSSQVNKHKEKIHFFNYCLQHFRNKQTLETHKTSRK